MCIRDRDTSIGYPFPVLRHLTSPVQEEENFYNFDGGNGTVYNPYRVSNIYHLNHVRNVPNAYFIQTQDIDLTAATTEGGAFYFEGSGWMPIGTEKTPFTGTYDGGGHRIIGLKSNREGVVGLFGFNKGIIQNLGMVDGTLSSLSNGYAGGIVGYSDGGSIANCYNTGIVSGGDAGGIVGSNDDDLSLIHI